MKNRNLLQCRVVLNLLDNGMNMSPVRENLNMGRIFSDDYLDVPLRTVTKCHKTIDQR